MMLSVDAMSNKAVSSLPTCVCVCVCVCVCARVCAFPCKDVLRPCILLSACGAKFGGKISCPCLGGGEPMSLVLDAASPYGSAGDASPKKKEKTEVLAAPAFWFSKTDDFSPASHAQLTLPSLVPYPPVYNTHLFVP